MPPDRRPVHPWWWIDSRTRFIKDAANNDSFLRQQQEQQTTHLRHHGFHHHHHDFSKLRDFCVIYVGMRLLGLEFQ